MDCIKIFKCLADKSRLLIIRNLMESPMYVELLAQRLGLSPSTVSFHLKKLEDCSIVKPIKEQYYVVYHINEDIFSNTIKELINSGDVDKDAQIQREKQYREEVIKNFFEYGRLKSIPVQQKKRKIVLEEIVKAFNKNKCYTEREVNIIIADFNDDFCTIRKAMIEFNLMIRENGIYTVVDN